MGDINFLGRENRVTRQVQGSAPANLEFRAPKYGSERTVYVSDGLLGMLAEHVRIHCPGSDSDRWLFGGRRGVGLPIFGSEVDRRWSAVRRAAGVSCRLHDMRDFYASGLIWSNCDVVTVQRAMGTHHRRRLGRPTRTCGRRPATAPARRPVNCSTAL